MELHDSNRGFDDNPLLPKISNEILNSLDPVKIETFTSLRKTLIEHLGTSSISYSEIPEQIKERLTKAIEKIATENDAEQCNYYFQVFTDTLEVIYSQSFYVTKQELEKLMVDLARRIHSSLPNLEVLWRFNSANEITQDFHYPYEQESLAEKYYDHLITETERNGEFNLEENLKSEIDLLKEKEDIIEDEDGNPAFVSKKKLIPKPEIYALEEFVANGDPYIQEMLIKSIEEDIEEIVLHIGIEDTLNWSYNKNNTLTDDEIQHNLKSQAEGRRKVEGRKNKSNLSESSKDSNEEWLRGARNREARYQEIIFYRNKRRENILKRMVSVKNRMNIFPPDTPQHKKALGEYLYLQDQLLGLEKLFNTQYGYYLWRQFHHKQFLIDKIRDNWRQRSNPDKRQEIKQDIKELRDTDEYGWRWDNRSF